jgi:hypothetical protein
VIGSVEVVFCEIFYRFLNPRSVDQNYPELPGLVEVSLSKDEQYILCLSRGSLLQYRAEAELRQAVPLYRERDMLNLLWLGQSPGPALLSATRRLAGRDGTSDTRPKTLPFERLPAAEQRQIVAYNQDLYRVGMLTKDNVHLLFLRRIARLIRAHDKRGVAFSPPLNRAFLDEYHLLDWEEYRRNMARVRDLCEQEGLCFVDCNEGPERLDLPGGCFHDAAHTLDAGAQQTGEHLFHLTRDLVLPPPRR